MTPGSRLNLNTVFSWMAIAIPKLQGLPRAPLNFDDMD